MFCSKMAISVEFIGEGKSVVFNSISFEHPLTKAIYKPCPAQGEEAEDESKFYITPTPMNQFGTYITVFRHYSEMKNIFIAKIIQFMRKLLILKY